MKKGIAATFFAVTIFSLLSAGCGAEKPDATSAGTTNEQVTENTETVAETAVEERTEVVEDVTEKVEESTEAEEVEPVYNFTDMSATMYAQTKVNVRDMPDTNGNKVGVLATNDEIIVTGQCNETGWYRISNNGKEAFICDRYLGDSKVENIKTEIDNSQNVAAVTDNTQTESVSGDWVQNLNVANSTSQLVIVAANGTTATVSLHNKNDDGSWGQVFSTNAMIGKNGIGKTSEGDGKTPTGMYSFTMAFGNGGNPGCTIGYTQTDSSYYWVDDSNSMYYNQLVSTNNVACDWSSGEHISDIGSYKYVLAVNYNYGCTPGLGSAIFFHCSSGRATLGCIAIPEANMVQLMQNLRGDCIIVIDSADNVNNY